MKEVLKNLKCRNSRMPFYAVARGREVGVYQSWNTCQELIANFKGAKYKKFDDRESAWNFVKQFRNKSVKPFTDSEEGAPLAKQSRMETEKKPEDSSSSTFDFAAFNLRLTNLENTYQEKIRSLEERLRALENERAGIAGGKKEEDVDKAGLNVAKAGGSVSATKRKLLETATQLVKPSSRNHSTSSLKKLRSEDDPSLNSDSSSCDGDASSSQAPPFKVDSDGFVVVYTDGACPKNGSTASKAGIGVWFNDGHPLNVSQGVTGRFTNNSAEIEAATVAAQTAANAGISKLCIMTDSQFTISCMTEWLRGWKMKNWKTVKNEPVIVKNEIMALEKACQELEEVKWVYVKGHDGVYGNERADELARQGAGM